MKSIARSLGSGPGLLSISCDSAERSRPASALVQPDPARRGDVGEVYLLEQRLVFAEVLCTSVHRVTRRGHLKR